MSDSMKERVARALCEDSGQPWDTIGNGLRRDRYLNYAKAAISAMREPTNHMLESAGTMEGFDGWDYFTEADQCHIDWWTAMIDAALNETDPN